jgi:hypothetical protein
LLLRRRAASVPAPIIAASARSMRSANAVLQNNGG